MESPVASFHDLPPATPLGEIGAFGGIHDALDPRAPSAAYVSLMTVAVALAVGAGFKLRAFCDVTDVTDPEHLDRRLSWYFEHGPETSATIAGEVWTLREFWRALANHDWCREHPEHPVSYLVAGLVQFGGIQELLRREGRLKRVRGKMTATGDIGKSSGTKARGRHLDYPVGLKPAVEQTLLARWAANPGGRESRKLLAEIYHQANARKKGEPTTVFKGDPDE